MQTPSAQLAREDLSPRERHELGILIALIGAIALLAPIVAWAGAAVALVFTAVWVISAHESRSVFLGGLARYHAPPFARACDCAAAVVRHLLSFARERSGRALADTMLALTFFALIIGSIALLEAQKHAPHLANAGVGLATGITLWHVALELVHEPDRLAHYRGALAPRIIQPWVLAATLLIELGVFLALETSGEVPNHPFLRGLLTGVAAMGLADIAALQSTLIAMVLRGRPLR